jgi:hypothetical protein
MRAKQRWSELQGRRSAVLQRARDAAKLTIPSLLPDEGANDSTDFPTPAQSLGARGLNNLSSKLLLTLMPPNSSFFRLRMDEDVARAFGQRKTDAEVRLSAIERKVIFRTEGSNLRPVLGETIKHLIVAGNAILYVAEDVRARMYRIDQFCVVRDASGKCLEAVIKECVHSTTLPETTRVACGVKESEHKNVDVYTLVKWEDGRVRYFEEINDVIVPQSSGDHPEDKTPWIVLRWTAVSNNDYGRSHVEEYMGDLISLESLTEAITGFAAVAAKIVPMVKPGSGTLAEDINNAENGEAIQGNRADVDFLSLDKGQDFQVAKATLDELTIRLSHAFLLQSGTVRNAERVTAEEIRAQAQELEDVLGGVYTVLAQELQLPLVRRLMAILEKLKVIPPLPKGFVAPVIVTGFEALGRNHTINQLRAYLADAQAMLGPQVVAQYINAEAVLKQLGTGYNIEALDELVKSSDQVQSETMQAQMAAMGQAAAGPVAGQLAKGAVEQPK